MPIDLGFIRLKTEELEQGVERLRDVEIADMIAAVFGTWSFIITLVFVLYTGDMFGILTGLLPSQFVALASGINVARERYGLDGWERMNQISLLAALWMLMASSMFPGHIVMQFSNTFAGMWIGLFSTYAAFLRQNDINRETVIQIRAPLF